MEQTARWFLLPLINRIIENVIKEIHAQLPLLPRKKIIEQSLLNRRFLVIEKAKEAFDFLNEYAPEHLIIASERCGKIVKVCKKCRQCFSWKFFA